VCRETATEFSRMKKFNNVLPRYRVTLVRESEDTFTKYPKFQNSGELFDSFREELSALDREHFFLVTLDSKNRTIGYHTVSVGSLAASIVHSRLCV
jgi:DNA repair protein RadC